MVLVLEGNRCKEVIAVFIHRGVIQCSVLCCRLGS